MDRTRVGETRAEAIGAPAQQSLQLVEWIGSHVRLSLRPSATLPSHPSVLRSGG